MDYQVKVQDFVGPLDLLLHLIRKNELDIYTISVAEIANQYLEYVELMETLNLDGVGEFLLMAATLAYHKSKMLLPVAADAGDSPKRMPAAMVAPLRDSPGKIASAWQAPMKSTPPSPSWT